MVTTYLKIMNAFVSETTNLASSNQMSLKCPVSHSGPAYTVNVQLHTVVKQMPWEYVGLMAILPSLPCPLAADIH